MVSNVHPVGIPDSPPNDPSQAHRWTPRLVFSLMTLVLLLETLTMSYLMISMAIPSIAAHYSTTQGAWLLTAFLLVGAITAPLIGKLADMHGKRKLLLVCVSLAALGSLICATAGTYAIMLLGRSVSGFLIPCLFLSYSLIRDVFPPKAVALAVSIATSGMGLIAVPAPFMTGWLLDNYGFRSIFWFFVVILTLLAGLITASTSESPVRLRSTLDLLGAVLLGAGIAGILIAVSVGPSRGWTDTSTLAYMIAGTALVCAWLIWARRVRDPLLDLEVLGNRPVLLTAVGAGFAYAAAGLYSILLPMLAMTPAVLDLGYGFGLTAQGFAVLQAPIGGMVVVGGIIVGLLVGRGARPRMMLALGLLTMTIGFVLTSLIHGNLALLVLFAAVFGTGMGLAYAAVPNLLIEAVPPELQASTASIVGVFQSVFPAVLPVIAFSVMNSLYIAPLATEATHGTIFYTDRGFQVAFMIGAVATLVGAAAAFLLPKSIVQVRKPTDNRLDRV